MKQKNNIRRFRLLNSEIGNDQKRPTISNASERTCFRLLNSEIGNDLVIIVSLILNVGSFRLLNSEIGNDHKAFKKELNTSYEFSSP